MTYFLADPNTWYTITSYVNFHTSNNASLEPYWPGGMTEDSVSLNNNGNLTKAQWQLYPVSQSVNGSYLLRPRVDPNGWLAAWTKKVNDPACVAEGVDCTRLANLWPNFAGNGVWTFTSDHSTGSYYLTDAEDGGSYLDLWPNEAYLRLNNNQTAHPSDAQRWQIIPTAQINDPVFQMINSSVILFDNSANTVPNVTYPSGSGPSTTSSATNGSPTSTSPASTTTSGVSTPTPTPIPHPKSAITAGVVAGVAIAFLILGIWIWWFLRRRKRQAAYQPASSNSNSPTALENLKPPSYGDSTPKQGEPELYEVEGNESLRHELSDGTGVQHELAGDERARHELAGSAGQRYELPG